MEAFGIYLLKSAVWLTGFTLVFLTVLRNERYFQLNRIYLLSGIVASLVFPLYTWHYAVIIPSEPTGNISLSGISAQVIDTSTPSIPIYYWLYAMGIGWLAFRLIWQTVKVIRKLRQAGYELAGSVKLVRTPDYAASFSFFSYVFVNPSTSDVETREIVNHEREHIEQRHWFDLLLAEFLCMLQWFNPLVWVYAHLIRQNHEYLADEKALQRTSDPAIYQATLLNQLLGVPVISLANSFSYSLNKKRFKMMKKHIHSPIRKLKLLLVLPLMALVFYAFAKPEFITASEQKAKSDFVNLMKNNQDNKGNVTGKVVNADGKPLAGTSVILRGSTMGTTTDENGNFKLTDLPRDGELVFSFVGYENQLAKPDFGSKMVVRMNPTTISIEKVTVTDNNSVNGPLYIVNGTIMAEEIAKAIEPNKIESVNVLKGENAIAKYGEKGNNGAIELNLKKGAIINVVGQEAIKIVASGKMRDTNAQSPPLGYKTGIEDSKNPPLIFVDGVVSDKARMDAINPETIESVNVLKDKSATDKYGEKGKNGVLEITLKKKEAIDVSEPKYVVGYPITNHLKTPASLIEFNSQTTDSKNPPLYILDGVTIDKAKMDAINPETIESINVLKDKSATIVYGEKGKDGVILITSKKNGVANQPAKVVQVEGRPLTEEVDQPFVIVEEMPKFPGGEQAMMKFIGDNVKYPKAAKENGITGTVIVNFIVTKTGEVIRVKIVRGIGGGCDEEAARVVALMPKWSPGLQGGQPVKVSYTIPIKFALDGNGLKKEVEDHLKKSNEPFVMVEEMPQFVGGFNELMKFIGTNVKYPAQAKAANVQGTVVVTFIIRSTGKVEEAKVAKGVQADMDAEALRVIELMPDWLPGKQHGKAVDVAYTIPIQFKLK